MNTTVTEHNGYVVAKLYGTIDEASTEDFDEQLHSIIEERGSRLLLDLVETDRITSAGIGNLVTLVARANAKGSRVVLARPSLFLSSVLRTTNLTRFFDVEPSVEQGVARLLNSCG